MDEQYPPSTSLILAAYNEEKIIAEKIKNSLALDYPKHLLEIVKVPCLSGKCTQLNLGRQLEAIRAGTSTASLFFAQ
jgi:hypothetical protein